MTRPLRLRIFRVIAVPVFLIFVAMPALAQEQKGFAKVGGYAGVAVLPDFTLDGETFDGMTAYQKVGGEEIIILPRLDKRTMIRAILGYRAPKYGFEFSYDRTSHDGTFFDEPVDATFQAINVDARYFFVTSGRFQPHVLVGGSFPWLRVKDGSFLDPDVGDARFRGYGINSEAGVTVYPHRQLGIAVGYNYRVIWFDRATGVADEFGELRPRFRETSRGLVVTGLFTF